MNLSPHFTLEEATHSDKALSLGIFNGNVSEEILTAARYTALNMEQVRAVLGYPIHIDSWIRCLELNRALGSKDTSQHLEGEAVDFICPTYGSPYQICVKLILEKVPFDQIILEHTWVHVSFSLKQRRGTVLSLQSDKTYKSGLFDKEGNKL